MPLHSLMNQIGYQAGSSAELPFNINVKFTNGTADQTRSDLIARWIEFWCQMNCEGQWRVTEYDTHVEIHFEDERELVLFKLSPEFDLH